LDTNCQQCHNPQKTRGGWDATTYQSVTTSGDNGPMVVPRDANSAIARDILRQGSFPMPPLESLSQSDIQIIMDWIAAGAPEK
jgi:hypothetical protein